MLILTRSPGEAVMIGDEIIIQVLAVDGQGQVKLGIEAPVSLVIRRQKLDTRMNAPVPSVVVMYKRRARVCVEDDG